MKTPRGNRSNDRVPEKLRHKPNRQTDITYNWNSMMKPHPQDDITKTYPHYVSFVLYGKDALPVEAWTLNQIREKFITLTKDYERDRWMPKVVLMISYILQREVVSLMDLAQFFGMPKWYLKGLCRRDPPFRRWIIWLRHQNLEHKAAEAKMALATGGSSILNRIQPNHYCEGKTLLRGKEVENPIDVGWRKKPVSFKR